MFVPTQAKHNKFTDEPYLANVDHEAPSISTHETVSSKRNRRRRRQRSSWSRSTESLLNEYRTNPDPWETRSIESPPEIKLDLLMEITSLLLLISNLSPDEPTCVPELIDNMVTVDHDLSGGVISSLYPEKGDAIEETTPSSTKESPYKTTCEEDDDDDNEEIIPSEFSSDALHEMTPDEEIITAIIDLYSANRNEPQISVLNLPPPVKEGM